MNSTDEQIRKSALGATVLSQGVFNPGNKTGDRTPSLDILKARLGQYRAAYKGEEFEIDTSGWKSYKKWGEDEHHRFFAERIRPESGNLAKILLKKRWSVILAENEHFITSDRPVVVQHTSREVFGIGTTGAVVSFPLSPTRILMMDDPAGGIGRVARVGRPAGIVVEQAHR